MWTVASEGLERLTSDAPFPASIEGFEYCQRRQFWEHSGKEGDSVIRDCVVVPQGLKGKLSKLSHLKSSRDLLPVELISSECD